MAFGSFTGKNAVLTGEIAGGLNCGVFYFKIQKSKFKSPEAASCFKCPVYKYFLLFTFEFSPANALFTNIFYFLLLNFQLQMPCSQIFFTFYF